MTVRQARECARDGCSHRYDPWDRQTGTPKRYCSVECWTDDKRSPEPIKRTQMPRSPSSAKRKPIAVASKEQAAKRNAGVSIVSGATVGLDAAHLCSRALGGCEDALCVVPLTRAEHRSFDEGGLDLLPYLVPHHVDEIAHALRHYRGDLIALLERLTGEKWMPVEREAEAA